MSTQKKDGGVEAPVSLGGLFFNPDDSDNDEETNEFDNSYENQQLQVDGMTLCIRQNSWHQTNANKVWPGTFLLAEFLRVRSERYNSGVSLELGAATGALAIFLRHHKFDIITWSVISNGLKDKSILNLQKSTFQ
jgi:hypothetical protein